MEFNIVIENVQHIEKLSLSLDLSLNRIMCIAGKNSIGKTTLLRSIRNIYRSDTFIQTAAPYIFNERSQVTYSVGQLELKFNYSRSLQSLDTKQNIPEDIKNLFLVELPIPHGQRFSRFRALSEIDEDIRAKIALSEYSTPTELINFLTEVYEDDRFENLKQVQIKGDVYYFILKDEVDRFYIREDYFSSGEYFLVSLYKNIQTRKKIILIDEIDISLDARAQVKLIDCLRHYCETFQLNIVFTTHSLALMKTLRPEEIFYIDKHDGAVSINNRSYNYIKSVLYGFSGYDKYILTEDKTLESYLRHLINDVQDLFFKFQIVYVGGGSEVIDLMRRNEANLYFSESQNVISVLDGDQLEKQYHLQIENVFYLPFSNVECELYDRYCNNDEVIPRVDSIEGGKRTKRAKNLYSKLIANVHGRGQLMPETRIFDYLNLLYKNEVEQLKANIVNFLKPGV
ncbi:hypothetical protein AYI84_18870 [Shewanella algae]|uniref:ATP-binding cassette domain-containing protein n=1 Tax=Shewanella algae TaxID=38313 RepID=UPI001181C934|nr:ATP-binding cassette domain-containing protein [Shewanella algae]TVK99347.1 hypothetical protein AYI84_18870 [Shewanella algae]